MDTDTIGLTLTAFPANRKVAVIRAIQELIGGTAEEVRDSIADLPFTMTRFDSRVDAEAECAKLQKVGATCELTPRVQDEAQSLQIQNWRNDIYEVRSMLEIAHRAAGIENDLHMATFLQKAARNLEAIADEMAEGGAA